MKLTFKRLGLGVAMLALLACDASQAEPGADSSTATASASAKPAPEPDKPEEPTITIVDKGKEPRVLLRYAPEPGQQEFVKITTETLSTMVEGKAGPKATPGATFTLKLTFKEKKDDALHYTVLVEKMDVEGDLRAAEKAAIEKTLGKLAGLAGTVTVSDRGLAREATLVAPDELPAETKMAAKNLRDTFLETVFVILPTARVGIGAKWERKHTMKTAGMEIEQTTTYELVDKGDGKAAVKASIVQTAKEQEMDVGPNVKMKILSMAAEGTTEARLDLAHLAPLEVTTETTSTTVMQQGSRPKKEIKTKTRNKLAGGID